MTTVFTEIARKVGEPDENGQWTETVYLRDSLFRIKKSVYTMTKGPVESKVPMDVVARKRLHREHEDEIPLRPEPFAIDVSRKYGVEADQNKAQDENTYYFADLPKPPKENVWTKRRQEAAANGDDDDDDLPAAAPAATTGRFVPRIASTATGANGMDSRQLEREARTLRVSNLPFHVSQQAVEALFGSLGLQLERVVVPKRNDESGGSRGFAWVTYRTRDDAERAMTEFYQHSFDGMVLQFEWSLKDQNK